MEEVRRGERGRGGLEDSLVQDGRLGRPTRAPFRLSVRSVIFFIRSSRHLK